MNPSLIVNLQLLERNIRNIILGREHRFHYDVNAQMFFCREKAAHHYFGNLRRGFSLYRKGLKNRGKALAQSYCIDQIEFHTNDIVLDCGANYGDLWLFLKDKISPTNYITFEPGKEEHKAIAQNAKAGRHLNQALGDGEKIQKFFIQHKHADSSLIEPSTYEKATYCEVVSLNSFLGNHNLQPIKLLKLEAEGFEPEIIQGGMKVLSQIEYVAIDGGYERGIQQAETFSECANHLFSLGFKIQSTNWHTHRVLFKNCGLAEGTTE